MLRVQFQPWSLFFLLSCCLLSGCGSDDSPAEPDSPSGEVVTILPPIANEALNQVQVSSTADGKAIIDLSQVVVDPQGLPLLLASVKPLDTGSACSEAAINQSGLSYTIDSSSVDVCYYNYTVKNIPDDEQQGLSASSTSTVVVSEYILSGKLPLIAETTDTETDDINIDLVAKLAGDFPTGYHLDDELLVMGDGTATADSAANIITYSPVAAGVTRVMYSLVSESGEDAKAGTVDISVSATADTMPSAKNFEFKTDIAPGGKVTIDVTNEDYCGGESCISDPDGDALQLTDVYAYNAEVDPTPHQDPADTLSNTSFDFSAELPGTYDVSYYVSDHNAGFAVGVVRINVVDNSTTPKPWDDIILTSNHERYTAPWEQGQADQIGLSYQQLYQEDNATGDYSIPLFGWLSSDALCKTRGMVLPSPGQAKKLYDAYRGKGGISVAENWPFQHAYWTSELVGGSNAKQYDFQTGALTSVVKTSAAIVTCVAVGQLSGLSTTKNNAYILPGDDHDSVKAKVSHVDASPLDGQTVYFYSDADDTSLVYNKHVGSTDKQGEFSVDIASTKPGDYWVYANYLTQTKSTKITFIDNPLTRVYFEPKSLTMKLGERRTVAVKAAYRSGTIVTITSEVELTSANNSVASGGSDGAVKANGSGSTHLSTLYTDNGATESASMLVTVVRTATGLRVSPTAVSLEVYEEKQLTAELRYDNGTTQDVTSEAIWSADGPGVTVQNGRVRAEQAGLTMVAASLDGFSAESFVKVEGVGPGVTWKEAKSICGSQSQLPDANKTYVRRDGDLFDASNYWSKDGMMGDIDEDDVVLQYVHEMVRDTDRGKIRGDQGSSLSELEHRPVICLEEIWEVGSRDGRGLSGTVGGGADKASR